MTTALHTQVYDDNMTALNERFPELRAKLAANTADISFPYEVVETASGQPNIFVPLSDGSGFKFHEGDDIIFPIRQQMSSWELKAADFLVCVGLGLGYVPLTGVRYFVTKPRVVVMEPHPEMLQLAMACVDLRELFNYARLDLFIGPDMNVAKIIRSYGESIFFGKNRVVSHSPSRLLYPGEFKNFENEVVDNIRMARNIGYTAKQNGKQIFSNTIKNLPNLFCGPDLKSLKGRFSGCPAICVAAGPSLDENLDTLKSVGHRALILCCDSAVRSLVSEGIIPHIVVTTDMHAVNFEKLRMSLHLLKDTVLVFSIEANPDSVGAFPSSRRIAVTAKNAMLNQWLGPKWDLDWRLPAMTSVSHSALFTAIALGAEPIALVGMDFAFSGGKSHAKGSVFRYKAAMDAVVKVDGVRGEPVYALPQLITDRTQIENAMADVGVRCVDTSLDGALIRGAENRSLQEVVDTLLPPESDVSRILKSIDWTPSVSTAAVIREFQGMKDRVRDLISTSRTRSDNCRDVLQEADQNDDGQIDVGRVRQMRQELTVFDRENNQLLSLLKLIRYGDVKTIARRLAALETGRDASDNPAVAAREALGIYGDYFGSVETAAGILETAVTTTCHYFERAAKLDQKPNTEPPADEPMLELARHYHAHGLLWKAEFVYQQYLAKHPGDIAVWVRRGQMFAEKGLWFLAGAIAEKLSEKFPSEPDTDVFAAELHHSVMDIRHRAVKALDSGAVEDARPLLYEYLSLVDADDDDRDTSLQERLDSHDRDIETALQQPESPDLSAELKLSLEGRAHDALEKGEIEKTTGILEGLALVDGSKAWQARERLGDVRLSQGDVPSARWHYEIALAQSPENTLLASKIEKIIKDRHNDEKIMEQTMNDPKTFGTQQPSEMASPEAMYASAQTRIEQEDYTAAVNVLENLLAKYPDYGLAHNDLGVLSFSRGDSEKSLFHYREAARIEPENTVFQKNLADFLYIVMGDVEPALKIYIDLLTKNPTDKETLLALGQICADQEKFDDAEVFYRRIQEIDPLNDDAQKGIAVLKERSAVAGPPPSGAPVQPSSPTGTYIEADSDHGMPSSVINAEISIQNRKRLIQIPEQQLSEANRIFDENAYAVLDRRRSNDSYTVFDVGAGVGLYALSVLNHRPDSQIFCFETADRSRSLLEINVGDMPGIVVCKFGLCNGGTEASLAPHAQNMGAKSACCSGSCHNGGGDLLLEDAGEQFDALGLTHLDVLKIETRGNEIDILESMGARLDSVDYILAAYHSEKDRRAIDALLIRFHLFGAANTTLGGGMVKYVHPALI